MGLIKGSLGAFAGSIAVWLSFYFIFHFDTWTMRLISIFTLNACIYLVAKILDKKFPCD